MALRIAIDSNRYVDFCKGEETIVGVVRRARQIVLPFIVVAELRAGFRFGSRAKKNESVFSRFLQSERVAILFADEGTTFCYAELFAELRRSGTPVPTNDLWIAALVIQHGLTLCSRDRHFDHFARLSRL